MANKLNMAIAKTHRLSTRLLGMQLTGGNFVGIALSAAQMSAGFLFLSVGLINGNAFMAGLVLLIGIALAILIERLSLGGLSAVRVTKERKKRVEDEFYNTLRREKRVAEEYELEDLKRQTKEYDREIRTAAMFAIVGMLLSATIGDVFWHTIFEPLKEWYLVYPMSTACAGVIGLTFIHSELYKAITDGVLKEILSDMSLMKVAVVVEEQNMQLDMMVAVYEAVQKSDDARKPAEDKIEKSVTKRLSNFADQVSQISDQVSGFNGHSIIESGPAYAQLPAPKGKYTSHRAELIRLLKANPNLSQRDIASHFSISRSTAKDWYDKLKAGI